MKREELERMARACGFAKMGVCGVSAFSRAHERVASEPPLAERRQLRFDPGQTCPWATSLLVLLWPYHPAPMPQDGRVFIDSYYEASNAAYHAARRLEEQLREAGCAAQANVSFPAKEAAVRAGLGVIGRSSLLITPEYGTRVVIILMATDALTADEAGDAGLDERCLGCGRCVRACPVGALDEHGMHHPERCLRNFMMEGVVVPEDVRPLMGMKLLGCDACQSACPMQTLPEQAPTVSIALGELMTADDSAFSKVVAGLAEKIGKNVARSQRVRAQAALLSGNRGNPADIPVLRRWAQSDASAVRAHAMWAIDRIAARTGLDQNDKKR